METVISQFPCAVHDVEISLTVNIGERQLGGSSAFLDGVDLGARGQISNLPLGRGRDLAGKSLLVKTLVADIRDDTDETFVEYVVNGAIAPDPMSASGKATEDGGGVMYFSTIIFALPD